MICKNCNGYFPSKTFLNGKEIFLHKRSYCLVCSPFGERKYKAAKRNRNKTANEKQCPICARVFKWTKNNVCSTCRAWFQRYCKKLKAINLLGGECKHCGEKDWEILTFHHINTQDKSFTLAGNWDNLDWQIIENELKKCEILCFNCHIKHHRKDKYDKYLKIKNYYLGPSGEIGDTQQIFRP